LTVGVVTKPFQFEGRKRMGQAEEGLRELKNAVDTLITIPNQRLLSIASRTTSLKEAFQKADDVLLQAVRGIAELVTVHGLINLDFADVRSIMAEMGMAMIGARGRRKSRGRSRTARDLESAARRRFDQGRSRPADQRHRRSRYVAVRSQRGGKPDSGRGSRRREYHFRRGYR
jgi:cell division protein FtsZ